LTKRYRVESVGNREQSNVIASAADELFPLGSLGRLDGGLQIATAPSSSRSGPSR
jgi:hypothetical protein